MQQALRASMTAVVVCLAVSWGGALGAAERFEVAEWVDHFDFAAVATAGGYMFDSETPEGCAKILTHVQEAGTTTVLWRNCSGATLRYPSAEDSAHRSAPMDKRRLLDSRAVYGWVDYGRSTPDLFLAVMQLCAQRGLKPGVHWPFEETHYAIWTVGRWNLEHPQFWGKTAEGRPWWGRCSLAFDEVVEHKLRLVDELIERGVESLFIDTWRIGGWTPAYEYVDPAVQSWRRKHGEDPPQPRDPRWCRHVAGYVTDYLRRVRQRLDASGRETDLMVGVPRIAPFGDEPLTSRAADWRRWIDEGIITTLVISSVRWDRAAPLESTRRLCREVMQVAAGRCRVLWPIQQYDFSGYGLPAYQEATGLSQAEIAAKLMEMAWEEGAAGVSLECVDYNNYGRETRDALRALAEGKCRWVKGEGE